jgi:uncharacterized UBP type Zn finger protein
LGYAGIKNLGCICYMISLLQQLYMIPFFRRGILSIDFNQIEQKKENPTPLEEQMVYQLQVMFAHLKETQKQYYNPLPFTNSFKDSNGNPMDVSVQMDVDEFFNILCDRIENYLKVIFWLSLGVLSFLFLLFFFFFSFSFSSFLVLFLFFSYFI